MFVKELVKILQDFPPDMPVYIEELRTPPEELTVIRVMPPHNYITILASRLVEQ
jgi:hypothetical protein